MNNSNIVDGGPTPIPTFGIAELQAVAIATKIKTL